ncbi:MAG: OmpA family protein [Candidatus Korobacteraceae bacterium]|jgi:hypothetical protein
MLNRFLLLFSLAATLVASGFAQSASPREQQGNNPAAQSSQPSAEVPGNPASDDLGPHQPLQPETRQGFWGRVNPFARKKYVQNQLSPIRNRVNELDELTANNSRMLKDVDARASEGIRQATALANQADQHALDAGNRAQQANATAQQASTRLQTVEQVVGNLDQYQAANQLELRFRQGQIALSQRDKNALDKIAAELKSQKGYIIEVQAFSPGRGEAAVRASQKMADAVVRYFVLKHEIPVYRIYELGMGNARTQRAAAGNTYAHRVDVTVLKNGVDQLAQVGPVSGYTTGSQGGGIGAAASAPAAQPKTSVMPGGVTASQ